MHRASVYVPARLWQRSLTHCLRAGACAVFYQLCACADAPELSALELNDAEDFRYTNQGGNGSAVIDNVDDAAELQTTRESLSLLGVSDADQMQVFTVLAGILHMGNVEIAAKSRRYE